MAMRALDTEGESGPAESDSTVSVTVHLRAAPSMPAANRQEAVVSRLTDLAGTGTIPEANIERWSGQVTVPVSDADTDAGAVELFEEFETAADEAGARLEPFFETKQAVGGLLSAGPSASKIIAFPVVCITIRRDEALTGLYPCWKDGEHHSVEECLDALDDGEPVENL
jgi:hypothetical protein